GTIPTWQAGQIEYPPIKPGMHHPNPFADDQPRLVINAANMSAHQSKLSAAHQLMLQRYPDFQLKVYPTRRTATYPQRVYDAVYQNALHAELVEGGEGVIQATTSSPFPIPANAHEVMWNHKLRYRGEAVQTHSGSAVVDSKGRYTLRKTDTLIKFMYSDPQRDQRSQDELAIMLLGSTTAPPKLAGNKLLVHEFINAMKEPRKSWIHLSGQRRTRRAPDIAYDAPVLISDSIALVDNTDMFSGAMDRFDWTLKGKRELFVPYNAYALHSDQRQYDELLTATHLNPEVLRYELHRVWVVEATLKKGFRHRYGKRVFYIDEDSWQVALLEQYDGKGNLMSLAEGHPINYYEKPLFWYTVEVIYDLEKGIYYASGLDNQEKMYDFSVSPKSSYFAPATLSRLR
ncbi:MAG: outer membrane lipoprotein-sorting protein, partial [Pseudomonadales bacterium]|nr:outer membrane lipoprotein-sorting protein [Pseudomonadales bacterium]